MDTLQIIQAILGTALAGAPLTAGATTLYQSLTRRRRRVELADAVLDSFAQTGVCAPPQPLSLDICSGYDVDLICEQLARNYAFLGEDSVDAVRKGKVPVVGYGGVGSWAAILFCSIGVRNVWLVAFDYVTLSSLNRHATALLTTPGGQ